MRNGNYHLLKNKKSIATDKRKKNERNEKIYDARRVLKCADMFN